MLVCLSEFYCLPTLNKFKIYPDIYYTDYDLFKSQIITFMDVDLIIITAGTCNFNRRRIVEFIQSLKARLDSKSDRGIRSLTVITDSSLSSLSEYYKFTGSLNRLDKYNGWNLVERNSNILSKFTSVPKESIVHLSKKDSGDVDEIIEDYKARYNSEDEYIKLIRVPDVKKMIKSS